MNRSEAHQQLLALANAMREGRIPDPRDYPILDAPTHDGQPLWHVTYGHLFNQDQPYRHAIDWLEYQAIHQLVLDDE
jgi:hypothetical protein